MDLICESTSINQIAENIKVSNKRNVARFECILQTANEINKNRRRYPKTVLDNSITEIREGVKGGYFIGELDHPTDTSPSRQCVVLMKEASHKICEIGWDDNKLVATLESLPTPNGNIIKNLALDRFPLGFSFRGMGEVKQVMENSYKVFEIVGPLKTITWDCVSNPSHSTARITRLSESERLDISKTLAESYIINESNITESNGMICTNEGICYLPNHFDELVERKVIELKSKYSL